METVRVSRRNLQKIDYAKLNSEGRDTEVLPAKMAEHGEESPLSLQPEGQDDFNSEPPWSVHDGEISSDAGSEGTDQAAAHEAGGADEGDPDGQDSQEGSATEDVDRELEKQNMAIQRSRWKREQMHARLLKQKQMAEQQLLEEQEKHEFEVMQAELEREI